MDGLSAVLLFSTLTLEQPAPKQQQPPWDWTLEERLDGRFTGKQSAGEQSSVVGREHPELLLPFEIFQGLVRLTLLPEGKELRAHFRERYRVRAKALGLGENFLAVLEEAARDYVTEEERLRRASREDARAGAAAETASKLIQCDRRTRALAALRERYGKALDRFLYEAVAPDINVVTDMTASALLAVEKGCR